MDHLEQVLFAHDDHPDSDFLPSSPHDPFDHPKQEDILSDPLDTSPTPNSNNNTNANTTSNNNNNNNANTTTTNNNRSNKNPGTTASTPASATNTRPTTGMPATNGPNATTASSAAATPPLPPPPPSQSSVSSEALRIALTTPDLLMPYRGLVVDEPASPQTHLPSHVGSVLHDGDPSSPLQENRRPAGTLSNIIPMGTNASAAAAAAATAAAVSTLAPASAAATTVATSSPMVDCAAAFQNVHLHPHLHPNSVPAAGGPPYGHGTAASNNAHQHQYHCTSNMTAALSAVMPLQQRQQPQQSQQPQHQHSTSSPYVVDMSGVPSSLLPPTPPPPLLAPMLVSKRVFTGGNSNLMIGIGSSMVPGAGTAAGATTAMSAKDKLAQRKQRNKESARRYREKQVARKRQLEFYTKTLTEQNRELETLHDRLLTLTCTTTINRQRQNQQVPHPTAAAAATAAAAVSSGQAGHVLGAHGHHAGIGGGAAVAAGHAHLLGHAHGQRGQLHHSH